MSVDNFLLSASATDLNYPEIRPSLDLNFARTKTLDPRITFTRSSGGSYVGADGLIKYAGVNEARFDHNPVTGESLGLLIEEPRTNLLTYSDDFNSWTKNNYNVSTNVITAPDGTLTADKIIPTNPNTYHDIFKTPSLSSNTYTLSIFAKAAEQSFIRLRIDDGVVGRGTFFNLSNGSIGSSLNVTSSTITPYPNGWYRCSITVTTNIINVVFTSSFTSSLNLYSGDGTSGIYVWGAQLEVGAFPTSYIPTQASTVTRFADVARIAGANFSSWYNQAEGTFYGDVFREFAITSGEFPVIVDVRNQSILNIIQFSYLIESLAGIYVLISGISQSELYPGGLTGIRRRRIAFAAATNNFAISVNGNSPLIDRVGNMPPITNLIMTIGSVNGNSQILNGTIRRITYWTKRLPNSQLQALTR